MTKASRSPHPSASARGGRDGRPPAASRPSKAPATIEAQGSARPRVRCAHSDASGKTMMLVCAALFSARPATFCSKFSRGTARLRSQFSVRTSRHLVARTLRVRQVAGFRIHRPRPFSINVGQCRTKAVLTVTARWQPLACRVARTPSDASADKAHTARLRCR